MTFRSRRKFFLHIITKNSSRKKSFSAQISERDAEAKKRRRRRRENDDEEGFIKVLVVEQKLNLGVESEETKRPRRDWKNSGMSVSFRRYFTRPLDGWGEEATRRTTTKSNNIFFSPEEQIKELEKAREMLRANYVKAYDAIERI